MNDPVRERGPTREAVALLNTSLGRLMDGRDVTQLLGAPNWSGEGWERHVPLALQEAWRSLGWEARICTYVLAEQAAERHASRHYR